MKGFEFDISQVINVGTKFELEDRVEKRYKDSPEVIKELISACLKFVGIDKAQSPIIKQNDMNNESPKQALFQPAITILTGKSGINSGNMDFKLKEPGSHNYIYPVSIHNHPAWVIARGGNWIGPPGGNAGGKSGTYTYKYEFDIQNPSDLVIEGVWASDNGMVATLNGHVIVNAPGGVADTFKAMNILESNKNDKLFLKGKNILEFNVENAWGPTGLYFNATIKQKRT